MRIVVGGVSGSGKSSVGEALAARLGVAYEDGDDLHPPENVEKMRSGEPLTDADRAPWLAAVGDWLAARADGVIACSALKRTYRDQLRSRADDVEVLMLHGDPDLIRERQAGRGQHFMPTGLMTSQLATFEPLQPDEAGAGIDVAASVEEVVTEYLRLRSGGSPSVGGAS